MNKFDNLTKYLPMIKNDSIGSWITDKENDGSSEHPIQMPFVDYSEMVRSFINNVYKFSEQNKDFELNKYVEILEKNGLKWDKKSMKEADVNSLDTKCVMALIMGAVRADRFSSGALLGFFRDGSIAKWLERLTHE